MELLEKELNKEKFNCTRCSKLNSDQLSIELPELKLPTFLDDASDPFVYYRLYLLFLNTLSSVDEISPSTKLQIFDEEFLMKIL